MAVRRPLFYNASGELKEMTDSQIAAVKSRMLWEYVNDPSVVLSVVSSAGNLGTITDTRLQAGAYSTSVSSYPPETTTAEPTVVNVAYSRISQTIITPTLTDTDNIACPVYYDGTNIVAMTFTDMIDTFAKDVCTSIALADVVYTISSATTLTGFTQVSSTPVFVDTQADTSLYTAASISTTPTVLDRPKTINSYYLYKANNAATPVCDVPLFIDKTGTTTFNYNMKTPSLASFATQLKDIVRYAAASTVNYRVRYAYNGTAGVNCGTGMSDTRLNGAGAWTTYFVNANDYRAQEFPNGTATTINTYYLKVRTE